MKRKIRNVVVFAVVVVSVIAWLIGISSREAGRSRPGTKIFNSKWPDSLDAVLAAPKSHRVIFENDSIRVLEVIVPPHTREPVHVHQWPGLMFGHHGADTAGYRLVYYSYTYDSLSHRLFFSDSTLVNHERPTPDFPDTAQTMAPEGPHSVLNASDNTLQMYRVEFKQKNRPVPGLPHN